jgi:drug/metabolite transporter (DMT)-like permease
MGVVGVVLIVGVELVSSLGEFIAAFGLLIAGSSYGFGGLVVKRIYHGVLPLVATFLSITVAGLLALPGAIVTVAHNDPGLGAWGAVLVLGVVNTAFAFAVYYHLIVTAGAGKAALVGYIAPAAGLLWGVTLLDEPLTYVSVAGLVMILVGVWLASRSGPPTGTRGSESWDKFDTAELELPPKPSKR